MAPKHSAEVLFCVLNHMYYSENTYGMGRRRSTVEITQNTDFFLVIFINYRITFHKSNCKPTFAQPCILDKPHSGMSYSAVVCNFNVDDSTKLIYKVLLVF